MRKIKEILRLRWGEGRSFKVIAASVGASCSSVFDCLTRAEKAGLSWPVDSELDDGQLEAMLYPQTADPRQAKAMPNFDYIHRELRRKGVTLQLLWHEYRLAHPQDGYYYSRFCEHYQRWRQKLDVVMRQPHRAGDKMFVDFSGDGIEIVDRKTGEIRQAEIFLAVLGASSYTYAEATPSQELPFWIRAHIHAFEFFHGVTAAVVPDNTKTGVTHPCYYEPDINSTYQELAEHYETTILPARKKKPKDKAKVETGVLLAQRWILAALRNHRFFSVDEANEAIWEKLEELNNRKFQKLDVSRRELYEQLDRPALRPLPASRYQFADWSRPRVNIDYHVEIDKHYYSVPYQLVHERLDARSTTATVELFFKSRRVASHARSYVRGGYTTLKEHMPKSHQAYLEWTPSRIISWAGKTGANTTGVVEAILSTRAHPEQGYRACLGIFRLGKHYGDQRLEAACARALAIGAPWYKTVQSILKRGLDRQLLDETNSRSLPRHGNVRGSNCYH